jgi:hypothetical protein
MIPEPICSTNCIRAKRPKINRFLERLLFPKSAGLNVHKTLTAIDPATIAEYGIDALFFGICLNVFSIVENWLTKGLPVDYLSCTFNFQLLCRIS